MCSLSGFAYTQPHQLALTDEKNQKIVTWLNDIMWVLFFLAFMCIALLILILFYVIKVQKWTIVKVSIARLLTSTRIQPSVYYLALKLVMAERLRLVVLHFLLLTGTQTIFPQKSRHGKMDPRHWQFIVSKTTICLILSFSQQHITAQCKNITLEAVQLASTTPNIKVMIHGTTF